MYGSSMYQWLSTPVIVTVVPWAHTICGGWIGATWVTGADTVGQLNWLSNCSVHRFIPHSVAVIEYPLTSFKCSLTPLDSCLSIGSNEIAYRCFLQPTKLRGHVESNPRVLPKLIFSLHDNPSDGMFFLLSNKRDELFETLDCSDCGAIRLTQFHWLTIPSHITDPG